MNDVAILSTCMPMITLDTNYLIHNLTGWYFFYYNKRLCLKETQVSFKDKHKLNVKRYKKGMPSN